MPTTILGRWSVGFLIAFIILWAASQFTGGGGEYFSYNLLRSISMSAATLAATAAMVSGLVAIIRQRERSWAVYLAVFIGLVISAFALGHLIGLVE